MTYKPQAAPKRPSLGQSRFIDKKRDTVVSAMKTMHMLELPEQDILNMAFREHRVAGSIAKIWYDNYVRNKTAL